MDSLTVKMRRKRLYDVIKDLPISPRKPLPLGMGMNRRVRRGILGKLSCKTTKFLV